MGDERLRIDAGLRIKDRGFGIQFLIKDEGLTIKDPKDLPGELVLRIECERSLGVRAGIGQAFELQLAIGQAREGVRVVGLQADGFGELACGFGVLLEDEQRQTQLEVRVGAAG